MPSFDAPKGKVNPKTATSASLINGDSLEVTHSSRNVTGKLLRAWQTVTPSDDVVLLLRGNGTDGSTSITDETGKTVTVNGNTQIDTAQSKFDGSSILFDDSGDYLTLADSDDWDFGSGDFTVEFWVRFAASGRGVLVTNIGVSGANISATFHSERTSGGAIRFFLVDLSGTGHMIDSPVVPNNQWIHVAAVRRGNTLSLYLDGTSVGTSDVTGVTANDSSESLSIGHQFGQYHNGHIDDLRIQKGTAAYTANFTPPTSAHPDPGGDPYEEERDPNSLFLIQHSGGEAQDATKTKFINNSGGTLTDVTVEVTVLPANEA